MRTKTIRTLSVILIVLALVTLSCEFSFDLGGKKTPTTAPITQQVTSAPLEPAEKPTQAPAALPTARPTSVPPTNPPIQQPTVAPTQMPTDIPEVVYTSEPYYTEEFDYVPDNWYYEVLQGNEAKTDISVANGKMTFTIEDFDTYAYVFYEDYTYTDVYIEASATNRGVNDNMITLVCRYSDSGFYEVNITNGGLYDIYAYVNTLNIGYQRLFNGGSKNIKMGFKNNVFGMTCQEDEITLYVNGVKERTVKDTKYNLPEGLIGVGVSSFDTTPVVIDFDYVYIGYP